MFRMQVHPPREGYFPTLAAVGKFFVVQIV